MWQWVVQNKQWIFSGAGLTVLAGLAWLIRWVLQRREQQPASAPVNAVTQAPSITVSPTFNVTAAAPEPVKPGPLPAAIVAPGRANLRIEATKIAHPFLEDDKWTLTPYNEVLAKRYKGLLVDVANVPTESGKIVAVKVRASMMVGTRNYSPLPWLGQRNNVVRFEPAARSSILLAVGDDQRMGAWYFVLNHRDEHDFSSSTRLDWTNMAPIPSQPLQILLVDISAGEVVAKFDYIWTFDSVLGFPILKTVPERGQ